jgi:predicted GTPase
MSSGSESDNSDIKENMSSDSEIKGAQPSKKRVIHAILIGESGVGKSAMINQVHNANVVESNDKPMGCTLESTKVSGPIEDHPDLELHLYDTAGLSESADGSVPTTKAFVQLIKLCYAIPGGIHLLIFCHKKGRIATKQFKTNYRIFYEELCEQHIPALLVITDCDDEQPTNRWWDENKSEIRGKLEFVFKDGVCVSTIKNRRDEPNKILKAYTESRSNLIEAIKTHASNKPVGIDSWKRKFMVYMRTVFNLLADWLSWLGFQRKSLRPELEQMFQELDFSPEEAETETNKLLTELANPDLMGPYKIVTKNSK